MQFSLCPASVMTSEGEIQVPGMSYYLMCIFFVTVIKEAIKVFQPLLLGKIIIYFENSDQDDQGSICMAYGYAAAISLSTFGLTILQHLYYYHVVRIGMKMRVAMCHMIYRKVSEHSVILQVCSPDSVSEK